MNFISEWKWWGGYNEEICVYGPCDTKEEVIAEAIDDRMGEFQDEDGNWKIGVHVAEARNDPIRLADWIEADRLLERADEDIYESDRVSSDYDDCGPIISCTHEQEKDLQDRIKAACDEWQAAHGLVFTVCTFSHTRNHEYVVVPHPDPEASA